MALTLLAMTVFAAPSGASSIVNLASLLGDPGSYQSEMVRVSGIVSNHRIRRWGGSKCYQSFTIKDGTGSIRVLHRANCAAAKTFLRNRDLVTLEGRLDWPAGKPAVLKARTILAKVAPSAQ